MSNAKISSLVNLSAPVAQDVLPLVDISDTITSGKATGTTKKVTIANLMSLSPVQSVAGRAGAVTLANTDVSGSASSVSLATDKASLTGLINARATGAQGTLADSATQPGDNISTLTNNSNFITSAGSPVQSVAGQTGAVSLANTDITGSASSVSLATDKASLTSLINLRALTSSLGTASTKDVGPNANNVVQLNASAQLPGVDGSLLTGISSAVEGSAVLSTGETGGTKYLREDGDDSSSWQPLVVGDEQLRGTTNPHIGAFPNQSRKVLSSNPSGSALMVADSIGLKFVVGSSANVFVVKGSSSPSRLAEASELPSFSISKDSGEPDIEVTDADGEVYSIITGDSDSLGANGLPARQGYQVPNIGANPSPLLISGGTIS